MSAQDIIYITPTEFNAVKDKVTVSEKIETLYKNLTSQYDCFTKPELVQAKFNTHRTSYHHDHGTLNKNHHRGKSFHAHANPKKRNQQHQQHQQLSNACCERPQISRMNVQDPHKDVKRVMKGLMNIINKNNYRKIFNKVKLLLCEDNVGVVIAIILETACLQVFFLSIFYQLLEDVLALLDTQSTLQVAHGIINDYIDTFIDKAEYMFCASDSSYHPYMLFCMQQKHKSVSSSRNLVVLELIKNNFSSHWTVQSYCNRLLETLGSLNESIQLNNDIDLNTDIIVGLLKEIKNKCSKTVIDFNHLKNIKGLESNSRVRFMVEDLFQS